MPLALQYGLSYEEFWHGEPLLLSIYQKAYYRKLHEEAHIYGYYNFIGMSTAITNAFRKKGEKAQNYIEKPIDVFKKKITKQNIKREYKNGLTNQMNWINSSSNNK